MQTLNVKSLFKRISPVVIDPMEEARKLAASRMTHGKVDDPQARIRFTCKNCGKSWTLRRIGQKLRRIMNSPDTSWHAKCSKGKRKGNLAIEELRKGRVIRRINMGDKK